MYSKNKSYLKAVIETLHPFGEVLQAGFGTGEAAEQIQKYHPRNHVILEADPERGAKARQWAKKHPTVSVLEESWQTALPQLGVFDTLFFGLPSEKKEVLSSSLVQTGKQLLEEIDEQFPEMAKIRYADRDLDVFCASVGEGAKRELARFLTELEQKRQISAEQKKKMREKYSLEELPAPHAEGVDPLLLFLAECVNSHMRKGSRFSCDLSHSSSSKSEDPLFFEAVLANPHLDYREQEIEGHIVMVIEKLS